MILGLWLVSSKPSNTFDKEEEIIKLEEKMLELKKENRLLKLQLNDSEKLSTVASSKEKDELIVLQKSNEEKEIKISQLMGKTQELEQAIQQANQSKETEKEQLIQIHMDEIAKLREELEKKNKELLALQESSKQQEKESKEPGEKMGTNETNAEMIRSIMNQFYVKFYQSVDGKNTLTTAEALKLTAEIIRKETKAALNSN